jgi:hypothetical protein
LKIIPVVKLDLSGSSGKKFSEKSVNKKILAATEKYLPVGIGHYSKKIGILRMEGNPANPSILRIPS